MFLPQSLLHPKWQTTITYDYHYLLYVLIFHSDKLPSYHPYDYHYVLYVLIIHSGKPPS